MDDKDARRSRVPAGTFGDSNPPSATEGDEPAAGADRKRFTNTLTGTGKGAFGDTDPPPVARMIPKRTGNTLVGHPSMPPPVPPGASAPVLSPPKWRGARAYMEGEEPQPRVSSIPTPPPTPEQAKPAGVPIGVMRSKVTTKVGQPVVAQPPAAAAQQPIDDTIERMLEGQASVRMQVEAEGDSIPEIPLDQLPIEELEDSLPRVPKAALAAVRAAEAQASKSATATSAQPAPRTSAATAESGPAEAAGSVSSVAPAEVVRRPRRDDSQTALGLLAVAVFALLFVGGWYATRGGYAPSRPAAAAAAPAPATVAPSGPSDLTPAPAAALTTPEPPASAPPAAAVPEAAKVAPSTDEAATKRAAARARSTTKPAADPSPPEPAAEVDEEEEEEGAEPAEGEQDVLTVKPQIDPESLPDIPGREEVRAALEPLRPAIAECSRGARGVAQLDITVSSSGAVSHAVVGGDFAGTAEGSCIARAARGAQFTPFKKPRFRVIYPFSL
jgi:hypothetical protein